MSEIVVRIKERLWERFLATSDNEIDENGYVDRPEQNLLPGVTVDQFVADLDQGSGSELEHRTMNGKEIKPKFCAVHSSSALAVNTFAPFKDDFSSLTLCGAEGFDYMKFEEKVETGLGGTPPNLDLLVRNEKCVVGIESKFLEILTPKKPEFSASYKRSAFPHVEDCWWQLLEQARDKRKPQRLDIAQLIKHYLGLKNQCADRDIILLYLFWEPNNWHDFSEYREHRAELAAMLYGTDDGSTRFLAQSYPELWQEWDRQDIMTEHVANLRQRYCVEA